MRKNRLLKQGLAAFMAFVMSVSPCLPGMLTVYGENGTIRTASEQNKEESGDQAADREDRWEKVQEEIREEKKATASDATSSDAMYDEDGFLLDGAIADDIESATMSDAELLLEGALLNVSENALLSGTCGKDGDNLVWELTGTEGDYTLRISGTGEMEDYLYHGPWFNCGYEINHWILEEGMTSIGVHAFDQCAPENNGVVTLPESVKVIGARAFMNSGMKSIELPQNLEKIEGSAFENCALTEIHLPDGLKEIWHSAFADCPIEELVLPGTIEVMGIHLLGYGYGWSNRSLKKVVACEGLKRIGGFESCASLEEVQLPSTLKTIGDHAFEDCSSLTHIDFPEGVEIIEKNAFNETGLEEILLPDSVKEIQDNAFNVFNPSGNVLNVHLPKRLEIIGDYAFGGIRKNADCNLPKSLKKIGNGAFYNFQWAVLEIPETVEEIGEEAFSECPLETIHVDDRNEVFVSSNSVLINKATNTLMLYPREREETYYSIPDGIVEIAKGAFQFTKLSKIVFPDTLKIIGDAAFYWSQLSEIEVPGSVKEICSRAFAECINLENAVFNDGLEIIGEEAFRSAGIKEVMLPDSVTFLGKGAFSSCKNVEKIRLSSGLSSISENAFAFPVSYMSDVKVKEIYIPEGVTCLEGKVFNRCGIEIYHIPHSLTSTRGGYNFQSHFLDNTSIHPKIVYYNGSEAEWNNISWAWGDQDICDATIIFNGNLENPQMTDVGWIEKDGHPWQYRRPDGTIINEGIYNLAYISSDDMLYIGNFRFENGVVMSGWDENQEHYYCGENDEYPYGMELPPEPAERDVLKDYNSPQAGRFLDSYDFALTTFNEDLKNHPILVTVLSPDHIDKLLDNTLVQFIKQLFKGNIKSLKDLDMAYWYTKPETAKKVLAGLIDDMAKMEDSLNSEADDPDFKYAYRVYKHAWGVDKSVMKLRTETKKDVKAIKDLFKDNEAFSAVSDTLDYASIKLNIDSGILESVDTMINMSDDLKKGFSDYSRNLEILEALEEACGAPGNSGISVSSADQDELLLEAIRGLKLDYQTQYITETADYITDWIDLNKAWLAFLDTDAVEGIKLDLKDNRTQLFSDKIKPDPTVYGLVKASFSVLESVGKLDGRPAAMESVLKMLTLRDCLIYKLDQMHAACMLKSVKGEKITDEERKLFELLFEVNKRLTIKQYGAMAVFYQGGLGIFGREQDKVNFLAGEIEKLEEMGPYTYAEAYDTDTHTGRYSASDFSNTSGWNGNHYKEGDVEYKNCWAWIIGRKYYFDENGEAYTGLRMMDDGKMRFFSFRDEGMIHAGAMQTGIVYFGNDEYYFMPGTGEMARDAYVSGRYYGKDGKRDPSQDTAFTYGVKANDPAVSKSEYMTMVRLKVRNADILDPSGSIILKVRDGAIMESSDERIELRETDNGICLYFPPEIKFTIDITVEDETETIGISITEYKDGGVLRNTTYNVNAEAGEKYTASVSSPEPAASETEEAELRDLSLTASGNELGFVIEPEVKTEEEIPYYRLEIHVGEHGSIHSGDTAQNKDSGELSESSGTQGGDGTDSGEGNASQGAEENPLFFVMPEGSTLPLTAVPDSGYRFKAWRCEDETLSSTETYIWTADQSTVIFADFIKETSDVGVSGITLDTVEKSLEEGEDFFLTAEVNPEDASNKNVVWSSSDSTVATVDQNGKVTAVKAGTATIIVTTEDGGKAASCTVTVRARAYPVTGVILDQTAKTVTKGDSFTLTAATVPENATNKAVSWSSSDTDIATVTASGKVTAVKAGTADITVTTEDGGYTAVCRVTVTQPVTGVTLNRTTNEVTEGDSFTLTANVVPADATNKKVTWSSSDTKVATVDQNGKVTAVKAGIARITVKTEDGAKTSYCNVSVKAKDLKSAFIERLYRTCLNREADAGGLNYWLGLVNSGSLKGITLAGKFVLSPEFTGKNYCDEHFVKQLYVALMDREADAGGLGYWTGRLANGEPRERIMNDFTSSVEYKKMCSEAGIVLGARIKEPKYGTKPYGACAVCGEKTKVVQFVERTYKECMGRAADEGGLKYWSKGLYEHTKTGKSLVTSFVLSTEMKNKKLSSKDYISAVYRVMLGREADQGGLNYWQGLMKKGKTIEDVINGFVDSKEFTRICNDYGIQRK